MSDNGKRPAMPNKGDGGIYDGLSKREYFAGLVMQGFAADPQTLGEPKEVARAAVKWADALLKALEPTS